MIERVWTARATRDGAVAYAAYFQRVVVPELAAVAGYRGARLLQRQIETTVVSDFPSGNIGAGSRTVDTVEIVVVTAWESLDVIRGFAGDDIDRAVVHDEAAALFSDYDRTVRHFEVVLAARTGWP